MSRTRPVVRIVDDDESVLRSIGRLVRSAGFEVETFDSPTRFLATHDASRPGCVVLDVAMPGLDGLDLQEALASEDFGLPVVFLTGHGTIGMSVRALKKGAVDFLTKPVEADRLLTAIEQALERDRVAREVERERSALRLRLSALTPREREVMAHVVAGKPNKQVAAELGTVEKTIKVHRARVMAKLEVESLADLVRLAERAGSLQV